MSPKRFRARVVLLDWDGTLLNSYAADSRAYLAMFRALKIGWGLAELKRCYSPDWYQVYRAAKVPRARWAGANRLWRAAYLAERPRLLPGARGVIRALGKGFTLGIVTGGSGDRVRPQLRAFGLADSFSACVCSEDAPRKKPHPAPLLRALQRLRAAPEECVYVGDAPEDIEMARRAGVAAIGVLGPFPTAERLRLAKPEVLLESIRDLPAHLVPHS
ncbi:MAG TPA: HAD family hydrolase [Candidatus Acidoferrales bacterium]|nr:HAD family hydrolase [Candidatus Acidoferrales bacterium]